MRPDTRLILMGIFALPLLFLLHCSGTEQPNDDDDDDSTVVGDDDDTSVAPIQPELVLGADPYESASGPGVWVVSYKLIGSAGSSFELTATYSLDGFTFKPVTLDSSSESLSGVSGSPDGSTHTLSWDTLSDLGYSSTEAWLRITGQGEGYDLAAATLKMESINNVVYDSPCYVEVDTPSRQDGDIPIVYRLWDPDGDVCSVGIIAHLSTGNVAATASDSQESDPLDDVEVTPEKVTRTFFWDSEADVRQADTTTAVSLTVTDQNNSESATISIAVRNSPVPDPGDVIFTELLPWPELAPVFVELYNTTHHSIDLTGLFLTTTGDSAEEYGDRVINATVSLAPGEYAVLTQGTSASYSDASVDFFPSRVEDVISLWRGDAENPTVIDSVPYTRTDFGGNEMYGHAISLAAGMDMTLNDEQANWCVEGLDESNPLPDSTMDYGTPGNPAGCDIQTGE